MGGKDKGSLDVLIVKRFLFRKIKMTVAAGDATEIKPTVGKGKEYQAPEYFGYNNYSYFDVEVDMAKQRCPQPKSGLTEFW